MPDDPGSCESRQPAAAALWTFALDLYACPAVKDHCLSLQTRAGADINLILLLLYAAVRGVGLGVSHVRQLDRSCADWRATVVRPVREIRQAVKHSEVPNSVEVYSMLKEAELAAEKAQLLLLEHEFRGL